MNLATTVLAAGAMLGAAAYVTSDRPGDAHAGEARNASAETATDRFRITVAGAKSSCLIERGMRGEGGTATLEASGSCAARPLLAAARYWKEDGKGAVSLTDGAGNAVMRFALADGAGWESYEPAAPILFLDPAD